MAVYTSLYNSSLQAYESHSSRLDDLHDQQKAVEKDVLRFREREKHLQRVKELQMKRPWVLFDKKRKEAEELRDISEDADAKYQEYHEQHIGPIRARLE